MTFDPRHQSRALVDGADRAAARSYFKAIGFTDEDLQRPLIGVAHCWIEITPCNWNHKKMAEKVKEGVRAAGGTPIEFNTISVTDGIWPVWLIDTGPMAGVTVATAASGMRFPLRARMWSRLMAEGSRWNSGISSSSTA